MSSILKSAKLTREKLLSQLRAELQADTDAQLAPLATEVTRLEQEIVAIDDKRNRETEYAAKMHAQREENFAWDRVALEIVAANWQKATQDFYKEGDNLAAWLAQSVTALADYDAGTIKAGKSYAKLAKLEMPKQHKLVEAKEITEEGFVFENTKVFLDAQLSTFLQSAFEARRAELVSKLLENV